MQHTSVIEEKIHSWGPEEFISDEIIDKLLEFADSENRLLKNLLKLLLEQINEGHVYLPLDKEFLNPRLPTELSPDFIDSLFDSGICGKPEENTPLIIEQEKLYFHKYHRLEKEIGDFIIKNTNIPPHKKSEKLPESFFQNTPSGIAKAVKNVLDYRFSVITGKPGTGKTTTLLKSLPAICKTSSEKKIIFIAAPTGRAMDRARLSVEEGIARLDEELRSEVQEKFILRFFTIHALLQSQRNAEDLLPYSDYLFIDECSMADMEMLGLLIRKLPPKSRLILTGDPNQLAAVNAGSVFFDIVLAMKNHPQSTILDHNFRFGESPGLSGLAETILDQNTERFFDLLENSKFPDVQFLDLANPQNYETLVRETTEFFFRLSLIEDEKELFANIGKRIILCAFRSDVKQVNRLVEEAIREKNPDKESGKLYHGLPIFIEKNLYEIGLFNGELGMMLRDKTDKGLYAAFLKDGNQIKKFLPGTIGRHSFGYATTIHKSQGSEYETVDLLLTDKNSEFLTRELLYTGATRAKKSLRIFSTREVLEKSIFQLKHRFCGLQEKLRKGLLLKN